ncbi:hypothetical protein AtNW77_Chr1g0021121 [Arabidopsis thaliana]|uniref:Uncharacterized protein n=5 Tax=Arabidopsis TaxID=3701 RepID=A0A8T2H4T3_ARASU|nr:hypothetical protein ISN45_At01g019230 [Arabidopsis thaliana x Arabidopsis arenosa]KAG7654805.1 hypothetical protein ISN44_As01g019400 [Arabidopsis suecica]
MTDPEKLTALKKAYAETILNTAKEAAARVMITERKARGYQQELASVRDEALRACLRLKQIYDSKVKEAEMISLQKQQKIEELEAQLGEAEDIVGELRMELRESRYLLEKLTNGCQTNLSKEEKAPNEAVSLEVREDSSNHERSVVASVIKPHMSDRDLSINRCSYKENKDPCLYTLPSILSRRREAEVVERNTINGDCADVESLTEARKEEAKENDIELSTTPLSPSEKQCIKFSYKRKHNKDGSNSPEGGGSSSQDDDDDDESRSRRHKTGEKDNAYLDSFTSTEPSRDSRRVAQVARQLLPFSEKKGLQQSQCDDVP